VSVEERIKWYIYLYKCHKARNPRIAAAYIKRIKALKKHSTLNILSH